MLCFCMGTMIMNIYQAFLKNLIDLTIKMHKSPDFDTFQQKFSNSLTFRIVLRHPKLFLKKGLDLLLPLG